MRVLISGGCKNGKSAYAQDLAVSMRRPGAPLYYIATMIPADNEDELRVARHRDDREGLGFETIEAGRDILTAVQTCDKRGSYLLDSVTALLANEMFLTDGSVDMSADKKLGVELTQLVSMVNDIVIISDFIYSDAFMFDDLTEAYRRGLAYLDMQLAAICDVVLEACAGAFIAHKGSVPHPHDTRIWEGALGL